MKITYDEYDRLEAICDQIREDNGSNVEHIDENKIFYFTMQRPTLEQLEKMDVEHHFEEYFPYLFFYYTQNLDNELSADIAEYEEYKKMKAYLNKLFQANIQFVE